MPAKKTRVRFTIAVEVDIIAWSAEYGTKPTVREARASVLDYFRRGDYLPEHMKPLLKASTEYPTARRYECSVMSSPYCTRSTRRPPRRKCTQCGAPITITTGTYVVFKWDETCHTLDNALCAYSRYPLASEYAGRSGGVVKFVDIETGKEHTTTPSPAQLEVLDTYHDKPAWLPDGWVGGYISGQYVVCSPDGDVTAP